MSSHTVIVGVGSNLGSREAAIDAAQLFLASHPQIELSDVSRLYETDPLGPPQPRYLNGAFRLETTLDAEALLDVLLDTERRLGRDRRSTVRWSARTLDLDLLWDARGDHRSESLVVPHPELVRRSFALSPLLDVAPELRPLYGPVLEGLGGALCPWTRMSSRHVTGEPTSVDVRVEADDLLDACALAASFEGWARFESAPISTHPRTIDSSTSAFAEALRQVVASGFAVRRTTLRHCSNTQWELRFHGVKAEHPSVEHVQLEVEEGTARRFRARLVAGTSRT